MIIIFTKNTLSNFGNANAVTSCLAAFLPVPTVGKFSS